MTQKTEYEIRVTRCHVLPKGQPLFSEMAAIVEIVDDAGGEYVCVTQQAEERGDQTQQITIDPADWPALRGAIERMISECRPETT